jgi:CGNR zinc finger
MDKATVSEIAQVQPRVGKGPLERLRWALEFAQKDLATLTVGDWLNLQREFVAFGATRSSLPEPKDAALKGARPGDGRGQERKWPRGLGNWRLFDFVLGPDDGRDKVFLPTKEKLEAVQGVWRKVIKPFLSADAVGWIGPLSFTLNVARADEEGRTRTSVIRDIGSDPDSLVPLGILLAGYAHRLGTCQAQGCGRWFVGDRKNQRFCSRACLNRESLKAFRERQAKAKIQSESDTAGSAPSRETQPPAALGHGTARSSDRELDELMEKVLPRDDRPWPDHRPVSGYAWPPTAEVRGTSATSRAARKQEPPRRRRRPIKK